MKRWSDRAGDRIENPKIDAFLDEIRLVCERHRLGISHQDTHGAFEVVSIDDADLGWLMAAQDCTRGNS